MLNLPGVCPLCALGLPHPDVGDLFPAPPADALNDWITAVRHTTEPLVGWAMSLHSHTDLLLMAIGSFTS
jgi:hypothetical protein